MSPQISKRIKEVSLVLAVLVAVFFITALASYHAADPGWSHTVTAAKVQNAAGRVGAWLADFSLYMLGISAYLVPILLLAGGLAYYRHRHEVHEERRYGLWASRTIGVILIFAMTSALLSLYVPVGAFTLPFNAGGVLGYVVGVGLSQFLGRAGTTIIVCGLWLIGITLLTGMAWSELCTKIWRVTYLTLAQLKNFLADVPWGALCKKVFKALKPSKKPIEAKPVVFQEEVFKPVIQHRPKPNKDNIVQLPVEQPKPKLAKQVKKSKPKINKRAATKSSLPKDQLPNAGDLPNLDLLDEPAQLSGQQFSDSELEMRSREVEERLADYGVQVQVTAVHPGPVVTRFELQLAAGTKVSKITALSKDLARSLSVVSVRVVEVISGKSVIGLELPNPKREMVSLRDVLGSSQYQSARSPLTLALGKDIAGHPVVADLAKMPHLLVAGTTGSGKSVGVNTMLMSLLYKCRPEDLRLILIDPKMLELSIYDDIPHLLAPVVTDMNDAATALRWCVVEMERRYKLMAALGVRNVAGYNTKVKEAAEKGAPLLDPLVNESSDDEPDELTELPKIVVVADEFADMMVVVGKKVETLITRLAQKARAAGIHLILATQRPSVDVITGLIKANIPSRISFQVSSKVDSRTILDQGGAEQLLGNGDMLYLPPGSGVPVRVHGAFVADDEVHRVVEFLKHTGQPDYLDEVLDDNSGEVDGYMSAVLGGGEKSDGDSEQDAYYDQAVEFVTKSRRVSISSIQRRFKIGYNRAANIVEAMEAAGVVSSMEGNGSRDVLAPPPVE